ncbi:hypothetical protein FO488_08810 [Geobacter sp. FeAm09]|uniref:general secretion pathway protein GspB n=1 Tax=Geobacter sp. FeAm09 TaxID=2597769 RepID=UPI0011EF9605|nr:general secretion pathway protein GspB [Geobacter sp. FeAm09]QEM68253.1 hypothetical protein FO488_08810 [Geobacter sp. FeAm09]
MSSILKALKKLEEEKSARTPDALKIDTEILRGGGPSRFPYRNVVLLAVLFFVCGSLLTYLYVKRGANPAVTVATLPPPEHAARPQAAQPPPAAVEVPGESRPAGRPQPRAQNTPAPVTVAAPHAKVKPSKQIRAATPLSAGQAKPGAAAVPAAATAPTPARRIPTLRVDGIAYHFGSADSLAVVNGNTVYVGAMVDGAKVEDIGKDRIRFSYEGERFDIPLGKSN